MKSLRLLRLFLGFAAFAGVAMIIGCGREIDLQKMATSLKPDMSEVEVRLAFKKCAVTETNGAGILEEEKSINHRQTGGDVDWTLRIFGNGKSYSRTLHFSANRFGQWDGCNVFFSTNSNLVGYSYFAIH
jgi:hypothetical protein